VGSGSSVYVLLPTLEDNDDHSLTRKQTAPSFPKPTCIFSNAPSSSIQFLPKPAMVFNLCLISLLVRPLCTFLYSALTLPIPISTPTLHDRTPLNTDTLPHTHPFYASQATPEASIPMLETATFHLQLKTNPRRFLELISL